MHLKKFLGIYTGVVLIYSSCAAPTIKHSATKEFDDNALEKLGVAQVNPSPNYPFAEFYNTGPIHGFDFRPDKGAVYFIKKDVKVENIFEYDFKERKIRQVTHYLDAVSGYNVDPNGRFLFIMKDIGGSEIYDLYRYDLKTKKTVAVTQGGNIERSYLCDVSKDGSLLYFSQSREKRTYYDIKAVDLSTLEVKTVKLADKEQLYCGTLDDSDKHLSFTRFIDNNEKHLGIIELSTLKAAYVLAEKGVANSDGVFDGNDKVYFLSSKDSDKYRLWQYSIHDKKLNLSNVEIDNNLESASIYSKGKISVLRYRGELAPETKIFKGAFRIERKLPIKADGIKGAFFDKDSDDLGVVIAQDGAAPKRYFLIRSGKAELFYDSNQSKIRDQDFAHTFSTFVSSFDGLRIPVHFFLPNGTSSKNKKPVAFWIHGGPEDNVDPEYSERIQYFANNGFIMVAPNVRGSTGFGKAYQFKDNGDWGGGHIKDIVAVAEYTKTLPFVDSENVFILGGSFGGFSVMSLITQYPTVFKAAVDIFGPIEFSTFLDSWPVNLQQYWLTELGRDPRVDKEFNKRVSPFYHINQIQIPLQVHQGANDIRVPKGQSDQLIEGLRKLGKEVEYFVYSDEGHGFTKFENSKQCFTRIVDYFKKQMNKTHSL